MSAQDRCFWCNVDSVEARSHYEGAHLTWCVHFREWQRGGWAASEEEYEVEMKRRLAFISALTSV